MPHIASLRSQTPSRSALAASVREDFPILATKMAGKPLVYLDNAATTQKPRCVIDAESTYYTTSNSNFGRGVYPLSIRSSELYEQARRNVQAFLNAEHPREIIFTKNTTEAINLVAASYGRADLASGDEILITGMEHHSNLLPWRILCDQVGAILRVVSTGPDGAIQADDVRNMLNERTRLVAVAHISNVLGTLNPIAEIIAYSHRHDIPVLIDGAQAVARRRVDVRDLDADFYCFSGHKMYGPMGTGVLYGKAERLERLIPYQTGGGTAKGVSYSDPIEFMPLPHRLEAGTPNIAGTVGLSAAIDYLLELGYDRIAAHDTELLKRMLRVVAEHDGVEVAGDPAVLAGGIVSFTVRGVHPFDVGNHLASFGIAARTGAHCAIPFVDSLDLVGTVRISVGVYNTEEEIDLVGEALASVTPGRWTAEHPTARMRF